ARLNTALQESPTETFTLFTSVDEQPQSQNYETDIEAVPASAETTSAPSLLVETEEAEGIDEIVPAATATEEIADETAASASPTPALRRPAVSPLLRPASRMRSSRHTTGHQRPEIGTETAAPTPSAATTSASPVELSGESTVSPVPQTEQPKPARRYRFDRPAAASNGILGTTPPIPTT